MYILALETTGAHASVAMIDQDGKIIEKHSHQILNHLQHLMPMVQELLQENSLMLQDVTAIAASQGPGSFTGIRIGISSARALAQILKIPTIAVPTLKTFAYNVPDYKGLICPILDARRSQVYAAAYQWKGDQLKEVVKGAPYAIEEFTSQISGDAMFFGDGIKSYHEYIEGCQIAPEDAQLQNAASVAKLALELYDEGQVVKYEQLKPNYMRKPEAERKLEEKNHE